MPVAAHPKTLRWGICGCGKISSDFANAISMTSGSSLVAVAARNAERSVKFAQRHSHSTGVVPRAYSSYDDIMQDSDVDIIYVGTINTTHKEVSLAALAVGKHVLCEKPLGLSRQGDDQIDRLSLLTCCPDMPSRTIAPMMLMWLALT